MKRNIILSVLGLLVLIGSLFPIAFGANDPLLLFFDEDRALTLEGSLQIATELDRIADQLEAPVLPRDSIGLYLLSVEIVPFFHYENISDRGEVPISARVIFSLREADTSDNFHNAGTCFVVDPPAITLNARYANPVASWYQRNYFAVLVHELGHSQGIFRGGDMNTEPATQLATLEVLAAMANDGNVWALPSFIRELQGYAEDFAWSKALQENRLDLLREYYRQTGDDVYATLRFERSLAHWKSDMPTLKYILRLYGETPYRLMLRAINNGARMSDMLKPFPNVIHRIFLDDTYRTIKYLNEMARDYPSLLEDYYRTHEE